MMLVLNEECGNQYASTPIIIIIITTTTTTTTTIIIIIIIITRRLQLQATVKRSRFDLDLDLESQYTLISLWFQTQVSVNRKGQLNYT